MPNPLELTVHSLTASQLNIKVKNIKGAALEQALTIDLNPPAFLLDSRIIAAGKAAAESEDPPGAASLAGIVTGPTAWSIWAKADVSDVSVPIMLRNDTSQTGAQINPPIKVEAGADFIIAIPLNPSAQPDNVEFPYVYKCGTDDSVEGTLQLKSDSGGWVPDVWLRIDQDSPSMITPGTKAKISWHIGSPVSATLRGPLPSGNTKLALSDSSESRYKMSDGELSMIVVGPVTYLLQAEVRAPEGRPNVQVVKMLSLDVSSPEKYVYVDAHPKRVLPFGLVEIDWAAWGIDDDVIIVAGDASRKIPLTELSLNGSRQGIGVMRITAAKPREPRVTETTVRLNYEVQNVLKTVTSTFDVIPWRKLNNKANFTGQPIGLAVAGPKMALLTSNGLWLATVGADDFNPVDYSSVEQVTFTAATTPTDPPKAWLAVAALGRKFIVLRQTQTDNVQVALYDGEGKQEGLAIDLPSELRSMMNRGGAVSEMAVYGGRTYVVVEGLLPAGPGRRAFSVSFESTTKLRNEPVLESVAGYRLLTFDDTLYALHRESGKVFRFSLKANGELDIPSRAASAISQSPDKPPSMIKQRLFAPVGRVMAVLDPSSLPSLQSLENFGLKNVLAYKNVGLLKDPNTIPQDLVYNPQHDRWVRSGHGLDVKPGMVCAFRGGDSPRLWVIEPNGDTYTLTVSSEHLFAHDYITRYQAKELAPFLNKKKEITVQHSTGLQLGPLNETCRSAGLTAFSATSPVEITSPLPTTLANGKPEKIEVRFNQLDPGVI